MDLNKNHNQAIADGGLEILQEEIALQDCTKKIVRLGKLMISEVKFKNELQNRIKELKAAQLHQVKKVLASKPTIV